MVWWYFFIVLGIFSQSGHGERDVTLLREGFHHFTNLNGDDVMFGKTLFCTDNLPMRNLQIFFTQDQNYFFLWFVHAALLIYCTIGNLLVKTSFFSKHSLWGLKIWLLRNVMHFFEATSNILQVNVDFKCLKVGILWHCHLCWPNLLVGPSGTGKTFITAHMISNLSTDKFINNIINFSARTSVNYTQG
jgi:hypothetical protein